MSFDQRVEQHHKLLFRDTFMQVTQYKGSKLRPYVTEQACSGEGAVAADLIGIVTYRRGTGRRRSNIENVPERTRRWLVYRDPIETGQYLDNEDKFRQAGQPDSMLVDAHVAAMRRGVDDTILGIDENGVVGEGGILGSVVEGKRPGGAGVALAAQFTTVHGGAGLTIAKLRAARLRLGLDDNDLETMTPVMAITSRQHDNLLGIVETASANLNMLEQPHIVEGKVKRLLGFNFLEVNRLPRDGTVRSCPVWVKQMIKLGVWQDIKPDMWNDSSARNTPYIHVDAYMDATRIEDLGVHVVQCTEA